jgi:hypothetical protein
MTEKQEKNNDEKSSLDKLDKTGHIFAGFRLDVKCCDWVCCY